MPNTLKKIKAREIFDSRGNPTVEVTLATDTHTATCSVPSGASKGSYEAVEIRDQDPYRYHGLGVQKAIHNIETIIEPAIMGATIKDQQAFDQVLRDLDGTKNKSQIGANAILAVSVAHAKLAAAGRGLELFQFINERCNYASPHNPKSIRLFANVLNGGAHVTSGTSVQEFQIIPMEDNLKQNLELIYTFQSRLKKELSTNTTCAIGVGDEGGYAASNMTTTQILDLLHNIKASMQIGGKISFGLDVAANELYKDAHYNLDGQHLKPHIYADIIEDLLVNYQIFAIEDPFAEFEFEAFRSLRKKQPNTMVIGDDITVTNPERLKKAIQMKSIDGIIIKPNQIGTLSETLDVISIAHQNNINCIASHRSGETCDDFIVDIAWGTQCFGVKLGALQRGERIAKYNRLLALNNNYYEK